jgi:hypothetical protein
MVYVADATAMLLAVQGQLHTSRVRDEVSQGVALGVA